MMVKLQSIQQGLFKKHKDHAEHRSCMQSLRVTL